MKLDGVLQTTSTTGTGDLTLDGMVASYRSFAEAVAAGDFAWGAEIDYVVEDADGREWGRAQVIEAGPTLKRTTGTVYGSTSAGARIAAAGGGVTRVFAALPDAMILMMDDLQALGGTIPETDRPNTFDGSQTIRLGNLTPAAGEPGPEVAFRTQNSVGAYDVTAALRQVIDGATDGAEAAGFDLVGQAAGAERVLLHVRSDGIAAPGYARKGADTAHFKELWIDGVQVSQGSGFVLHPGFADGEELGPPHVIASLSSLDPSAELLGHRLYFTPIFVPRPATIANLALTVPVWSSADAERIRFGLYENSNGAPTDRIAQTGAITIAGAGDIVAAVTPVAVPAGWYWAASYWYDVGGIDNLTVRTVAPTYPWPTRYADSNAYTGGLPAAAPVTVKPSPLLSTSVMPRMRLVTA